MKKYLITVSLIVVLGSSSLFTFAKSYEAEFVYAVEWMHDLGLTKYASVNEFLPENQLTREQAAKFFLNFSQALDLELQTNTENNCSFDDANEFDSTLSSSIIGACEGGLFKGVKGNFLPKDSLTKAEALTVLIRATQGVQDETVSPWWNNYFLKAKELGYTKETDVWSLDRPVTRYEIALILLRASGQDLSFLPQGGDSSNDIDELQGLIDGFGGFIHSS